MNRVISLAALICTFPLFVTPSGARSLETLARDPYLGAIVVDAADGRVLFEDNADAIGYPASVLKLMTLLLVVEKVEAGQLRLIDRVRVTADAARMGGSQVYLKGGEVFTVDELLDALMIQSANDAAVALAQHVAGSRSAFVRMMNERAAALGMTRTRFVTEHGLPPPQGGEPDVTTARDLAKLGVELARHPLVFRYTAIQERGFRNDTFIMRNHNKLLGQVEGVDGFKTGYFRAAGYSILATAQRGGARVIAAVLGSVNRQTRDEKTKEFLALGFLNNPRRISAPSAAAAAAPRGPSPQGGPPPGDKPNLKPAAKGETLPADEGASAPVGDGSGARGSRRWWWLAGGAVALAGIGWAVATRRRSAEEDDLTGSLRNRKGPPA